MTPTARLGIAIALSLGLAGCSDSTRKTFGLEANPPDAFDVGTQAPLSLPPELGTLQPPNPGEPRPQQVDASAAGADVISPETAITPPPNNASAGEQALLQQAGPTPPASIREDVNQSALIASRSPGFVANLMGTAPAPPPAVDAPAESQRLEENAALGQPATTGATPQQPPPQGFFARIFSFF